MLNWNTEITKRKLFNAKDISIRKSYIVRGIGQYFFRPNGISPYLGLGINLAINVFDGDEIERQDDLRSILHRVGALDMGSWEWRGLSSL